MSGLEKGCVSVDGMLTYWGGVIGELVFGVARIFASFNDTFVHVTDLRFVCTSTLIPFEFSAGGTARRGKSGTQGASWESEIGMWKGEGGGGGWWQTRRAEYIAGIYFVQLLTQNILAVKWKGNRCSSYRWYEGQSRP